MEFRRQKRHQDGVNLTPLIDVVFLLLIFFMVSTTFTRETRLTVDLPEADGASAPAEVPEQLEVVIGRDGSYSVNGKVLVNRKIDTIMKALEDQSGRDTSMPIVITADDEAPHGAVVRAMDAAGRLGFQKLSITTQEPRESDP